MWSMKGRKVQVSRSPKPLPITNESIFAVGLFSLLCSLHVVLAYSLSERGKSEDGNDIGPSSPLFGVENLSKDSTLFSVDNYVDDIGEGGGGGSGAEGLKCICDDGVCEHLRAEECEYGITFDMCRCCLVCARGEHEPCGGGQGTCAFGLHCRFNDIENKMINGKNQTSTAAASKLLLLEGTCSRVGHCDIFEDQYGCVVDPEGHCVCLTLKTCPGENVFLFKNKSSCESQISLFIAKRELEPALISAQLTDKTILRGMHAVAGDCSDVTCPPVEPCPADSYRFPVPVVNMNSAMPGNPRQLNCCPSQKQKCRCIPKVLCATKECPPGWASHVLRNATGKPGGCCQKYECLSPSMSPNHLGVGSTSPVAIDFWTLASSRWMGH